MLGQLQHGPVALAAGGTVKAVGPIIMDPLMVAEVSGQAEGLPTKVTHVALLTVNSHMVTQRHVVGIGLATKVASEFWKDKCCGRLEVIRFTKLIHSSEASECDSRSSVSYSNDS